MIQGPLVPSKLKIDYVSSKKRLFTARKRSLRRLCFYRCLSVHRGGCPSKGGFSIRGGSPSKGGFSIQGGFSIRGGSPSGGILHPRGVLHPGGSPSGGVLHPRGGSPSKGGFSIQGGVLHLGRVHHPRGVLHPGGFLHPGGVLHPVNVRAVRILLECILVIDRFSCFVSQNQFFN